MAKYHYQCKFCYRTTRMWEDDSDGIGGWGAIDDCGCNQEQETYYQEMFDDDD